MSQPIRGAALFKNPEFDEERYLRDMEKPAAPRTFGIFFTPRSGSSWLTDVLTQTRLLGRPQEWFNPNFLPNTVRAVNARSLDGYVQMLRRKHGAGGFFSFEITIYQMRRVFGGDQQFVDYIPPAMPLFYLTRQDMILQAVSLAKAVNTSVFHSASSSADAIEKADAEFDYNAKEIAKWLDHIFDQERRCERLFSHFHLRPHRLIYEENVNQGAAAVAQTFLRILRPRGATPALPDLTSAHRKIASSRSIEFAERFRAEHPAKIGEIEGFRADVQKSLR